MHMRTRKRTCTHIHAPCLLSCAAPSHLWALPAGRPHQRLGQWSLRLLDFEPPEPRFQINLLKTYPGHGVCEQSAEKGLIGPLVVCQGGPHNQEDTGVLGVGLGGTVASLLVTLALSGIIRLGEASGCVEDTQMALYRGPRSLQSKASKEPKSAGGPVSGLGGRSPQRLHL